MREIAEATAGGLISNQLLSVIEAMTDGVWVCDSNMTLLWINSACEELNEIKRENVCGRTVDELLGEGNFDTDVTHQVLKNKKSVAIIQQVKSGRTLLVNGVPVLTRMVMCPWWLVVRGT